jgi:hypothetical protein
MTLLFNCMPEAETLVDLARRECAIGFELRFRRSVAVPVFARRLSGMPATVAATTSASAWV